MNNKEVISWNLKSKKSKNTNRKVSGLLLVGWNPVTWAIGSITKGRGAR